MNDKSAGVKAAAMVFIMGEISQALEKELNRGRKPIKPCEPCDTCANNRQDCNDICRGGSKELYPGCEIRIKTCSAYRREQLNSN